MGASLSLRRPNNWQYFETLCKKLWGEIWNCPEIKKNGRAGQAQHGIDVYGIPFGESNYYGIQCKGKDEYSNKQFNEEEINNEIEKAKLFQPPLKKLYLATTAVKDAGIEELVRKKNIENINKGLFEVHIFSWEDIVELIDENKHTHDFYVNGQNYKTSKSVSVTFKDGLNEIYIKPKFKKTIIHSKQKDFFEDTFSKKLEAIAHQHNHLSDYLFTSKSLNSTKVNLSYCEFYFQIHNTGLDPLEEYKLFFDFEGDVHDLKKSNEEYNGIGANIVSANRHITNVYLFTESMSVKVVPQKNILVGDDIFTSDSIYIKPSATNYEIIVNWKLISKDFKDEGKLKIIVNPEFEKNYKSIIVEDPKQVGIKEGDKIEDVIIEKDDL